MLFEQRHQWADLICVLASAIPSFIVTISLVGLVMLALTAPWSARSPHRALFRVLHYSPSQQCFWKRGSKGVHFFSINAQGKVLLNWCQLPLPCYKLDENSFYHHSWPCGASFVGNLGLSSSCDACQCPLSKYGRHNSLPGCYTQLPTHQQALGHCRVSWNGSFYYAEALPCLLPGKHVQGSWVRPCPMIARLAMAFQD